MLQYPFSFKLDDGTNVTVNTTNTIVYQFDVTEANGGQFHFEWHIFRGKDGQPKDYHKVLDAYREIADESRFALN